MNQVDQSSLASWGSRVCALFIDGLLVGLVGGLVLAVAGVGSKDIRPIVAVIQMIYMIAMLSRKGEGNGQTVGKRTMKIRVVRADGQPLSVGDAVRRELVGRDLLGFLTLGLYILVDYLWPLWGQEQPGPA